MPNYNIVLLAADGSALQTIVDFESLHMEFNLDKANVIPNIIIDGRVGPQIDSVVELATDIVVYRNNVKLFRGRIHYTQDNIGPNRHTVTLSAIDYRGLLDRRIFNDSITNNPWNNVDQGTIAWEIVDLTNINTDAGNWDIGVDSSSLTTGVNRDRLYEPGQNVGQALQQLSEVINGFDYEIDANKIFRLFYPERGTEKSFVLDLGGNVLQVSRTVSSSDYANSIRVNGGENEQGSAPFHVTTVADIATTPEGRFESQIGFPDITVATTLVERAEFELARRAVINPSYSLRIADNRWEGPDQVWLGDTVQLVIKSGRLNVISDVRIRKFDIKLNQDGEEVINIDVGNEQAELGLRMVDYDSRLRSLERN